MLFEMKESFDAPNRHRRLAGMLRMSAIGHQTVAHGAQLLGALEAELTADFTSISSGARRRGLDLRRE